MPVFKKKKTLTQPTIKLDSEKRVPVISLKDTGFYIKIALTNLSRLCQSTYLYAFICLR